MRPFASWMTVWGLALLCGCAEGIFSSSPDSSSTPIGLQMVKASPELAGRRFSNLLDFETRNDAVFVTASSMRAGIDSSRFHTGHASLLLTASPDASIAGTLAIKLSSLIGSQAFPGKWTLLGGYFYSDRPARITASCEVGGRPFAQTITTIPGGKWVAVMVDLANPLEGARAGGGAASLAFHVDSTSDVWCDDVVLIDNTQWIIGSEKSLRANDFSVCRKGMRFVCTNPEAFSLRLPLADFSPDGWKLEEADKFRVRFSSTGKNKLITLYPDGRSYQDGEYRPLSAELRGLPVWGQQHATPAQIDVPESLGRLDRRSEGDANNDGYNEARASYMIVANGPRLAFTLTPGAAPIYRPLLEISGLPMGDALVTIEGSLIQKTFRLDDGTLLIELPGLIDHPTSVNIRVQ